MGGSILVIRGGAIGDFILTLPALGLLREAFSGSRIEIMGYRHIVSLAEGRHYADASRSIEYGPMAAFFVPGGELAPELMEYFSGFSQVVSYLYDPEGYFGANLRRAGVRNLLCAYERLHDGEHAAVQLARPLQGLALFLEDRAPRVYLSATDRSFAEEFLEGGRRWLALHPGSGSGRKNWPLDRWVSVVCGLLDRCPDARLLVVGGEADGGQLRALERTFGQRMLLAEGLPLPQLGAVLERCHLFLGHDSGISHLAGAVGTAAVLLFGPTDPMVWAPANAGVRVLAAPLNNLALLSTGEVLEAAWSAWCEAGPQGSEGGAASRRS